MMSVEIDKQDHDYVILFQESPRMQARASQMNGGLIIEIRST